MNRSRTALAIAAGVAAGVTVVAVAAVAADTHRPTRSVSTASGTDVELQALAQVQGDSASPSASAVPSGGARKGWGGGLLGGGLLHGTVVVQGADGKPVTVAIQRGTVTSVGGGHLVVRSSDGFSQTWATSSTTRYAIPGRLGRGPWTGGRGQLGPSASPSTSPTPSASAPGSSVVKGSVVMVLGRTQGSGTPTARLVVSVPDGAGLTTGRWGPGWAGPMGGPMGGGLRHDLGPRWGGPSGAPRPAPSAAAPSPKA